MRAFAREHTVEEQLEEFEGGRVRADISRVTNTTAPDGDAGTIGIVFFRTNFTNYDGVVDFISFVGGNIVIVDEKESVSARNLFGGGGGCWYIAVDTLSTLGSLFSSSLL